MELQKAALEVIYLPISSLKPHPQNPRVHKEKQVGQIAQSIKAFGLTCRFWWTSGSM
jgi:ParB-like chromosome segregation protein Spo0J